MTLAELGHRFRNARIDADLTQSEVAAMTGVPRTRISLFETGAIRELGALKLIGLFDAVGLELQPRPVGHQRTLDDARVEQLSDSTEQPGDRAPAQRKRVRRARLASSGAGHK